MSTGICVIDRIIIAIAIQIQTVDGFGIQVGGIVGGDESTPLRAVVSGVTVVEASVAVVVVTTITDGIGVCHIVAGGLVGNGAVAPGVVQILGLQSAVDIVDGNHIALQVSLEVVGAGHATGGQFHANDTAFIIQEDDVFIGSAFTVNGLVNGFRNQTAGMVIAIASGVSSELTDLHRVGTGSALHIGVASGYPLTKRIVHIIVAVGTSCQSAGEQAGQLALGPGCSLAFVRSRAAHGIVANGGATETGQPVIGVTEGGSHRRAGGRGAERVGISLHRCQVANTIIVVNIGFCKSRKIRLACKCRPACFWGIGVMELSMPLCARCYC